MLVDAEVIDKDLVSWPNMLPSYWHCTRRDDSSWGEDVAFYGRIDNYYDVHIASVWNCYRRLRIALLDMILKLSARDNVRDHVDRATLNRRCSSTIQGLTDDILGSIPYHLGRSFISDCRNGIAFPPLESDEIEVIHRRNAIIVGPIVLLLPLSKLSDLDCLRQDQLKWIARQKSRIYGILGRRYHLEPAAVAVLFSTVPAFGSNQPINSRSLK